MPSGKTHLRVELGMLVLIAGTGLLLNHLSQYVQWDDAVSVVFCFGGSYLFSSLFMSPDLDLASSRPARRWGVLRYLWLPYAACFRHWGVSHNPLLGPLTRIGYLGLLVSAALAGLHYGLGVEMTFMRQWWDDLGGRPLWAIGIGLFLPNQVHILVDRLSN